MAKKVLISIAASLSIVIVVVTAGFYFLGKQSRETTPDIGRVDGLLKPCGSKPNCSSSFHNDEKFRVESASFLTDQSVFIENLKKLMLDMGATLEDQKDNYLHFVQLSKFWGFADDIEFLIDANVKKVDFKSSSRVGYSDMGANKKRLLLIIEKLKALPQ